MHFETAKMAFEEWGRERRAGGGFDTDQLKEGAVKGRDVERGKVEVDEKAGEERIGNAHA